MGLKAPEGTNTKFVEQKQFEDGNYNARVVRVIDLGTQSKPGYPAGSPPKVGHVIRVTYELPEELMVDENGNEMEDKPRWQDEEFFLRSLTSKLATSTERSKAIDPTGELDGDWSQYLGLPVVITLETSGKYTNVKGATPMRKRDIERLPELKNPAKFFDLTAPDMEVFNSLPQWLQAKICNNLNFKGSKLEELLDGKPVTWSKGQGRQTSEEPKEEAPKKAVKQAEPPVQAEGEEAAEDMPW